jgi:hypothetical protein
MAKTNRSRAAVARAWVWATLIAGSVGLGAWAAAQQGAAPAQARQVFVVQAFPTSEGQALLSALESAAKASGAGPSGLTCRSFLTMGDETQASEVAQRAKRETPAAMIYLDARSARSLLAKVNAPSICVARTRESLWAPSLAGVAKGRLLVLETQPPAQSVARALGGLRLKAPQLGLVYTRGDRGNEKFLAELRQAMKSKPWGKVEIVECPLDPGACQNALAARSVLRKRLDRLSSSGLLLALPSMNTLKFAFAIQEYARQRSIGLVGIGDFDPAGTVAHVAFAPEDLARACVDRIARLARSPGACFGEFAAPKPRVVFNRNAIAAGGAGPASSPNGGASRAGR